MSPLPGNPHYDACIEVVERLAQSRTETEKILRSAEGLQVTATLAVAFEQRTANLIAYVVGIDDTSATIPVVNEIRARLGIEATK